MSETAKEPKKISKRSSEEKIEIIVAIFLGITALATAWASWIGSLHGGNQATNYTKSNNLSSEGNSMWNEASQNLMQDMITWNDINEANLNYQYAESKNDKAEMEKYQYQIDQLMSDNCTEELCSVLQLQVLFLPLYICLQFRCRQDSIFSVISEWHKTKYSVLTAVKANAFAAVFL